MAEGVRFDIVLTDDGQAAGRPAAPSPSPTLREPPGGGGQGEGRPPAPAPSPSLRGGDRETEGGPAPSPGGGPEGGGADEGAGEGRPGALARAGAAVAKTFDMVATSAKRAADSLVPLAANDHMALLSASADAAGKALSYIPEVGGALQGSLKSITSTFQAAGAVVTAFVDRGKQLADYSPDLAASGARAEITSILADMREANELGPGLSRLTDAQSDLMALVRELLLPIKKFVVDALASFLEGTVSFTRDVIDWMEKARYFMFDLLPALMKSILEGPRAVALIADGVGFALDAMDRRQKAERDREKREKDRDVLDLAMERMFAEIAAREPVHGLPGAAP